MSDDSGGVLPIRSIPFTLFFLISLHADFFAEPSAVGDQRAHGTAASVASDLLSASTISTIITTSSVTSGTPTGAGTSATFSGAEMLYRANVQLIPRRGSMPCDMLSSSTVFGSRSSSNSNSNNGGGGGNGGGGKSSSSSRSSRKKLLRRRSAGGGADILAPIFGDPLDDDDGDGVDVRIADRSACVESSAAAAATASGAGASDGGCFDEAGDDQEDGNSSDAIAAAAIASASRFRLKRGSEVTLTRSGHQRNGGDGGGNGDMEALLSRRRGSLPVEMLSISCSGEFRPATFCDVGAFTSFSSSH